MKKTNAKTKAKDAATDDEGYLCIQGARLWKWRALEAELRAGHAELEQASQRIAGEIAKNPELAALIQQKAALAGTISTARAELLSMQGEIESDLNLSLKDHAFDEKTGRLYHLGADGSREVPVKAKAKKKRS